MELRHLRYFVAVAESLSFTKAAARLHLAQPSLTRQVHNLEDEIGVPLLDRAKRQVALTEEGRSFMADAKRVLTLVAESVQAVQRLSRGETGQLNIAYSPNVDFELLHETLALAPIKKLPHIGVVFRPLVPPVKVSYWIAWNRSNESRALRQYTRIVKNRAAHAD